MMTTVRWLLVAVTWPCLLAQISIDIIGIDINTPDINTDTNTGTNVQVDDNVLELTCFAGTSMATSTSFETIPTSNTCGVKGSGQCFKAVYGDMAPTGDLYYERGCLHSLSCNVGATRSLANPNRTANIYCCGTDHCNSAGETSARKAWTGLATLFTAVIVSAAS